jgi:hypothetical protein
MPAARLRHCWLNAWAGDPPGEPVLEATGLKDPYGFPASVRLTAPVIKCQRSSPVQEQHAFPFLREIILFLILAGILIPTLQRLRINQVLGFLAAGTLLGPFGLGLVAARFPGWPGSPSPAARAWRCWPKSACCS